MLHKVNQQTHCSYVRACPYHAINAKQIHVAQNALSFQSSRYLKFLSYTISH